MKKQSIAAADRRERKEDFALNLIRAMAIIFVLMAHSLRPYAEDTATFIIKLTADSATMMFVMVSGALLLPVTGSYSGFMRKRIVRVLVPYTVWCLINSFLIYSEGWINEATLANDIRWTWLSYGFLAGWFVPFIMSLYMIMPLLSPWIATASRRHFHYVLILWLLSGLMPFTFPLFGVHSDFYLFQTFACGMPFAVMGYYIAHWRNRQPLLPSYVLPQAGDSESTSRMRRCTHRRKLIILYALLILVSVVLPLVLRPCFRSVNFMKMCTGTFSLPSIAMNLLMFSLLIRVKTLGRWLDRVVNFIAHISYGIYLVHIPIYNVIMPCYFPEIECATPLFFLVLFTSSAVIAALLRKIPFFGRYIVG